MQQKIDFLIKISKFLFIFQLIKFFMQHPVAYTTKSFTNKKKSRPFRRDLFYQGVTSQSIFAFKFNNLIVRERS
jgi:hypothetical protein